MRALVSLPVPLPALAANLNDTGITFCGDDTTNTANCASVAADSGIHPRQDARYGRDAQAITKIGGGEAGFDFTALNASGQPTTPSSGATPHPCVRDNVTGLVWEVKTADGGLRDQKWSYTWYDSVHNSRGPRYRQLPLWRNASRFLTETGGSVTDLTVRPCGRKAGIRGL